MDAVQLATADLGAKYRFVYTSSRFVRAIIADLKRRSPHCAAIGVCRPPPEHCPGTRESNRERGTPVVKPAPTVCIIIPTYNRAQLVTRSIDSVLAQSYGDIGLIVVDDGSHDETDSTLRRYEDEPRVRVVRHEHNRGVTAAKNSGLDLIPPDSKYFGILDSDDVLLPDAVAVLVRVFESSGEAYSQVMGWYRDRRGAEVSGEMPYREGLVTYQDALCGRFRGDFWKLVRRAMLGDGRFEERASGGEASLWWPMLKHRPGWLVPDVVGLVDTAGVDRISARGYSPDEALQKMWAYQAVLDAVGPDMRRLAPRQFGDASAQMAKWAVLAGCSGRARRASWQAVRASPSRRSIMIGLLALAPPTLFRWLVNARAGVGARLGSG